MTALAVACVIFADAPPAAAAGWDRVTFGMRSDEIAAAYRGQAVILSSPIVFGDSYVDVALREVHFAGYPFRVYFQMDPKTRRLTHVMLERRRQYADAKSWNALVTELRSEIGAPALICDRPGGRGVPTMLDAVWRISDETIEASFLDFMAPDVKLDPDGTIASGARLDLELRYRAASPERRILLRYSPPADTGRGCAGR